MMTLWRFLTCNPQHEVWLRHYTDEPFIRIGLAIIAIIGLAIIAIGVFILFIGFYRYARLWLYG